MLFKLLLILLFTLYLHSNRFFMVFKQNYTFSSGAVGALQKFQYFE